MNDRAPATRASPRSSCRRDTPGLRFGTPDDKLGIRGAQVGARCSSTTCGSRPTHVLGEVGGGFKVAMSTLDGGRIGIAAQALGIARAALEDALAYAQRAQARSASRSPSTRRSSSSSPTWRTEIDAARLLTCGRVAQGPASSRYGKEAAMAKLFASDMAQPRGARGDPDLRRLRLRHRVPGRAPLPRRQDHRDLRGHERDPAPGDCFCPVAELVSAQAGGKTHG